jgi:glycosyltransferase involved in cell wall biosynthesis/2-polyprenyl-3-methyl-5-hydroxy-6-metoxy-1,4-benzoquinol methylase
MLNPQPSDEDLHNIYRTGGKHVSELKQATATNHLQLLRLYGSIKNINLLEVTCGQSVFSSEAVKFGLKVTAIEYSPLSGKFVQSKPGVESSVLYGKVDEFITEEKEEEKKYDACYLSDVLSRVRDPKQFLQKIHRLLKPNGSVFISVPNTDSWSAKYLKDNWTEFKPEYLHYFNTSNLESLLFHCGFREIITRRDVITTNNNYISAHYRLFQIPIISIIVKALLMIFPPSFKLNAFKEMPDKMIMMGRAHKKRKKRRLSVVVPVFNEVATFESLLNRLLVKQIDGLDIEIVIVESNSTDGTRDIALKYKDNPRVKLVLEDRPEGKGHAVRTGLKHISGDFVLIQDADLEYDLEDYDNLLEPLLSGREAFVLGSRHGGRTWKIRKMEGNPFSSFVFNCAHWAFAASVNILYGVLLKDPFTMFKVFRRDCLYGLNFECNKFDFDYELVIKLVRKGYKPTEIPVNYNARSFKEGKKISILKDPWTWVRAIVKYRFVKIDPLSVINEAELTEYSTPNDSSGHHG